MNDNTYPEDLTAGLAPVADCVRPFIASLPAADLCAVARAQLATFPAEDVHPRSLHAICAELEARYRRVLTLIADLHGESL